jgi:hypothetical protein
MANSITSPNDFTSASWSKANVTVTSGAITAPDGISLADLLTTTTTNGEHMVRQVVAAHIAEPWELSFDLKANGYNFCRFRLFNYNATSNYLTVFFTLRQELKI